MVARTPAPGAVLFHEAPAELYAQGERDKMQRSRYLQFTLLAGALALAAGMAKPVNADPVPSGWTAEDVAKTKPATAGTTTTAAATSGSAADTVWTVTGTGGDVWDTQDAGFQFAHTTLTGDGGITARLLTQTGGADTDWSKTGTMLREGTDPGSPDAFLSYASATGGKSKLTFQPSFRANPNGKPVGPGSSNPTDSYGSDAVEPVPGTHRLDAGPIWLRTQRQGTTYQHLVSNDGKNWLLLASETVNIDPNKPVLAGIWASQGGSMTPNVVTYDNVSVDNTVVKPVASTVVPAPTNLTAMTSNGAVLLLFQPDPGAVGVHIYRKTGSGTPMLLNVQPDPYSWFEDTEATSGTSWDYTVKSVTDLSLFGAGTVESVAPAAAVTAKPAGP